MKKALLVLGVLILAVTLAGPAMAQKDMKGMWGPGYFTTDAPVGLRYWLAPKLGADLGIGFYSREFATATDTKKKTGFAFDFGLPFVLAGNESTLFFFRPGIGFNSDPVSADDNSTDLTIRASLGVEHFFSDRFSLQVAHGLYWQNHDPGTPNSDTSSSFSTEAFGISNIGFHYYLFPSK